MSEEEVPYKVSYIAAAPDNLSAGDVVKIIDTESVCEELVGKIGVVVKVYPYESLLVNMDFDKRNYVVSTRLVCKVGKKERRSETAISPIEYICANKLGFFQGSIITLITDYKEKGGKKALEEIKRFCDTIIEKEYSK